MNRRSFVKMIGLFPAAGLVYVPVKAETHLPVGVTREFELSGPDRKLYRCLMWVRADKCHCIQTYCDMGKYGQYCVLFDGDSSIIDIEETATSHIQAYLKAGKVLKTE